MMGGGADGLDPYPQLASGCYLAKYVYAWRFAARTPTPYPQPFGHRTKLGCIDTIAMSFQPRPSSKHTYFERYNVSAALMPPLERHEQRHSRINYSSSSPSPLSSPPSSGVSSSPPCSSSAAIMFLISIAY